MWRIIILLFMGIEVLSSGPLPAQTLDGRPYRPGIDPNIDLLMSSWKENKPYLTHGVLQECDILTPGDPLNPPKRGALLKYMKRFTYATLNPGDKTTPVTLSGEQEIFYVLSGKGRMGASMKTYEISAGAAVLVPEGLGFTIENTGSEVLCMYLICEPVTKDFKPRKDIFIRNENELTYRSTNGHWSHMAKELIMEKDGLSVLQAVLTVTFAKMTIGHPHSHDATYGAEEVWTAISGTSVAWIGKQIRMQPPGTAYIIPPNGTTPHSNINTNDGEIKLFYFAVGAGAMGSGPGKLNGPGILWR
jgi:mannose-6-phosphate isomerase-like protein (cupin superfamily)